MFTLEDVSRACATICRPLPVPSLTQKIEDVSAAAEGSAFTTKEYWPDAFAMRRP